jgi:hypothetical protein
MIAPKTSTCRRHGLTLAALLTLGSPALTAQVEYPLEARAAHIHVASSDLATVPTVITLSDLGVGPGDCLRIRTLGDFDYGPGGDEGDSSIGLFSSDATLLDEALLHRVPGALDAGEDWMTSPTYYGSEITDIPEDFRISGVEQDEVIVTIPAGATVLFVSVHDTLFVDNSDPDGDYRVELTKVGCWFDIGSALAGTAGEPHVDGSGLLLGGDPVNLDLTNGRANAATYLILGLSEALIPFKGGVLAPSPDFVLSGFNTDAAGELHLTTDWPVGVPSDTPMVFQFWIVDPVGPHGAAASQGVECISP